MSHFTEVTQEDIDLTAPVPPGYYWVLIDDFEVKQSKRGDSDNYELKGHILSDENGDTKYANRKTPWWGYNTKLMGLCKGLWESLGVEYKAGVRLDWEALKGRKVCVFIAQQLYQGNMTNSMTNKFKPAA